MQFYYCIVFIRSLYIVLFPRWTMTSNWTVVRLNRSILSDSFWNLRCIAIQLADLGSLIYKTEIYEVDLVCVVHNKTDKKNKPASIPPNVEVDCSI